MFCQVYTWGSPITGPILGRPGSPVTPLPLNLSGNTLPITSMGTNYNYGFVLVDGRDAYVWGFGESSPRLTPFVTDDGQAP